MLKPRKVIKEFLETRRTNLHLLREKTIDVISHWRLVRNPSRVILNYFILNLCNLTYSMKMKNFMLTRLLGMKIGKGVGIAPCSFDVIYPEMITIGDGSTIGWKAKLLTHGFTQNDLHFGKITIGKNVLIGAFTSIKPGVTIGDNSVIASDSFVNKDVPVNELWAGIPAKKIRKVENEDD